MEHFDVFLAHNSLDKPLVRAIAQKLKQQNLKPWLDEEQIQGGDRIIQAVFNGISLSKTGAFFIGQNGLGNFQANLELDTVIHSFLERQSQGFRVIPVLLPGVSDVPKELWYLKQWRWIKFSSSNDESALQDLIRSIRNQELKTTRPGNSINLSLIRRQFLQWFAWGTVGLLTTVGGREILLKLNQPTAPKYEPTIKVEPTPTQTPEKDEPTIKVEPTPTQTLELEASEIIPLEKTIDSISLESEKGIDYTKLRNLLAAKNWKEADQETYWVMIQAVGRKDGDVFTSKELLNFPCTDLHTIDQMWIRYSRGHFGLSIQKKIYLSVGGKTDSKHDEEALKKFGDRVGWRVESSWISRSSVTFNISSPRGHLPTPSAVGLRLQSNDYLLRFTPVAWRLFYRIETCKV